jgi:hypothetical protein
MGNQPLWLLAKQPPPSGIRWIRRFFIGDDADVVDEMSALARYRHRANQAWYDPAGWCEAARNWRRKEVIWMARPRNEVGGEVQYLTVRECALELGIHPQTLKNWLIGNVHGTRTLLEPVRVGFQSVMLIIPLDRFRRFQAQDWPAIRKKMEQRGWGPKPEEGGQL